MVETSEDIKAAVDQAVKEEQKVIESEGTGENEPGKKKKKKKKKNKGGNQPDDIGGGENLPEEKKEDTPK